MENKNEIGFYGYRTSRTNVYDWKRLSAVLFILILGFALGLIAGNRECKESVKPMITVKATAIDSSGEMYDDSFHINTRDVWEAGEGDSKIDSSVSRIGDNTTDTFFLYLEPYKIVETGADYILIYKNGMHSSISKEIPQTKRITFKLTKRGEKAYFKTNPHLDHIDYFTFVDGEIIEYCPSKEKEFVPYDTLKTGGQ